MIQPGEEAIIPLSLKQINLWKSQYKVNQFICIKLCICIKNSQHQEMRKNNSKLYFMKNHQMSWFSLRWLKISKYSISLAWLGECSEKGYSTLVALCTEKFSEGYVSKCSLFVLHAFSTHFVWLDITASSHSSS